MLDEFNQAAGGNASSNILNSLQGMAPSMGGAKKRRRVARTQKRGPKRSSTPKRKHAPTKKRQRQRKPRRPRRSRRGGVFNALPALALLAANEGAKRHTNSSLYSNARRWHAK